MFRIIILLMLCTLIPTVVAPSQQPDTMEVCESECGAEGMATEPVEVWRSSCRLYADGYYQLVEYRVLCGDGSEAGCGEFQPCSPQ